MMAGAGNMRRLAAMLVAAVLPALLGCNGFFVPENGGGGGGGTGGNYVYVANSTTNSVSGFAVGTGRLSTVPNSPLALGYSPIAMTVTPSNSFLYVAGPGSINVYLIGTDGSLTVPSTGSGVVIANVVSLDVSPDGNWLFGLDATQQVLDVFAISPSTGGLTIMTAPAPYSIQDGVWVPRMVRVSRDGTLVFAALGTAGDTVFTFNTSTGVAIASTHLNIGATTSDNALAVDSTTANLYLARSGVGPGVAVYKIGAGGQLNVVTGSPFAAGTQTFSVVLDTTGKYVYAANRADSTISGYSIGTGAVLTPLSGSPYSSGSLVASLGVDKSGKYLLAAAYGGAPDLTMYSFDSATPGKLVPATSMATGTDPAGAIAVALTH
jgi:6-phosphogluconolactonase